MSAVEKVIMERSSTRAYTEKRLTREQLDALILAGLRSPTATNRQELHFTVLDGDSPILADIEREKNRLRDLHDLPHNFYYEAPTVILISAETAFRWSEVDAGIAVQSMALEAQELGLGSLIIGCIRDALTGDMSERFSKLLGFPEGYGFVIALAAGYKAAEKQPHTFDAANQVTYL